MDANEGNRADAITFDVPNLDDASVDPADYEELADTFRKLAEYAEHRARAMRARLEGDCRKSGAIMSYAEHYYRHLPEWARW